MGTQHTRFADWLQTRRGPREPELEAALLRAAAAYDRVQETGQLLPEELHIIVEAVSSPRALLWMNAIELLGPLSEKWVQASDAIAEMFRSRKAHVRFNAICCIGRGTPGAVTDAILRSGLKDRSARVRWKAAETMETLKKHELIPELTAALGVEQNAKTRRTIEFSLLLLRDGYILKSVPDGRLQVTVGTDYGGCSSRIVDDEELRAKGIDTIVAEFQEEVNRKFGAFWQAVHQPTDEQKQLYDALWKHLVQRPTSEDG